MYKPIVAIVSLAAGIAVTGNVIHMQHETPAMPDSWSPALDQGDDEASMVAATERSHAGAARNEPKVDRQIPGKKTRNPLKTPASETSRGLSPCSGWRNLGPKALTNSDGSVVERRFRLLC